MARNIDLSFVTTIYKSANEVRPFYEAAKQTAKNLGLTYEVIFVDDGSPDNGFEMAKELAAEESSVKLARLSRNFGQHKAIWTGLELSNGKLVAILDGDMEENPAWIEQFHNAMQMHDADAVYGVQDAPKGSGFYRFGRNAYYRLLDRFTPHSFPRNLATARLMSRAYVDALLLHEESEIWLNGLMHVAGFSQVGVRVKKEQSSPTSYNLKSLVIVSLTSLTAFSTAPLVLVFLLGILMSISALIFVCYLAFQYFMFGVGVPGWTSVIAVTLLSSGLLTLFNGVIAIYISTIFLEVKRRPRTIVKELVNFKGRESKGANIVVDREV